jgi:SAM-dependent methyltransferase
MVSSPDFSGFREFERVGWESNTADYDAAFARLTTQSAAPLLDAAGVVRGTRVLDVATGPGYVAGLAAARDADVVGVDFSAAMVDHARRTQPGARFQGGDAESLPFAAATFDAVVMSYGMLHLANPERAIAEAARVLAPGGRFAFTVWAPPEMAIGFGIILAAVQAHGMADVGLPDGPPFFRFSDPAECQRVLEDAGFADVRVTTVPLVWTFDKPEQLFDALYSAGVRTKAMLRAQSAEALRVIRHAVAEATSRYLRNGVVELPMPAVLASGLKP